MRRRRIVEVEVELLAPRVSVTPSVAPAPDETGQARRHVLRHAERLADLAHGAAGAVADHDGGQRGAVAAIGVVDPLDHLLAALVLEVDVDVGRLAPLLGDEALEQQVVLGRIDRGDAEHVAHGGVRRRAAALAEDAARLGEAHDGVHGEEVGRVAQLLDQVQLVPELAATTSGTPSG